jgi:hypothetical protein
MYIYDAYTSYCAHDQSVFPHGCRTRSQAVSEVLCTSWKRSKRAQYQNNIRTTRGMCGMFGMCGMYGMCRGERGMVWGGPHLRPNRTAEHDRASHPHILAFSHSRIRVFAYSCIRVARDMNRRTLTHTRHSSTVSRPLVPNPLERLNSHKGDRLYIALL